MGLKDKLSKKKELVVREAEEKRLRVSPTPEMLIQQALDQKTPVETMEKLMAMRKELKEEQAREAFMRDLAGFQGECPVIKKTKVVLNKDKKSVRYQYAPLDDIVEQVSPYLSKYGFSYTIETINEKDPPAILSILTAHHIEGHSRTTEFRCPIGSTDFMTLQQAYASASTFSKRYCFQNGFGIITGDEDDDATSGDIPVDKKEPEKPMVKSNEYKAIEKQIFKDVKNKHFTGNVPVDGADVGLIGVRAQVQEMLKKRVYSDKKINEVRERVAKMLKLAIDRDSTPPKEDASTKQPAQSEETVIEKPEVVEEKKPLIKSTEYLEIEARIIKDILHPEFIGKVLFTSDDGKTNEVDLGHYKRKMPDLLAKNVCSMEELEKKADVVARLLLVATTKHEKFKTPDPKPAGMVENPENRPTNQEQMDGEVQPNMEPEGEGQGTFFDEIDGDAAVEIEREGNAETGGGG